MGRCIRPDARSIVVGVGATTPRRPACFGLARDARAWHQIFRRLRADACTHARSLRRRRTRHIGRDRPSTPRSRRSTAPTLATTPAPTHPLPVQATPTAQRRPPAIRSITAPRPTARPRTPPRSRQPSMRAPARAAPSTSTTALPHRDAPPEERSRRSSRCERRDPRDPRRRRLPHAVAATDNTQLKSCRKSLLCAESVQNLRIEGTGIIDGNGNTPKWIGPSTLHPEYTRPTAFFAVKSKNVSLKDVTIAPKYGVDDVVVKSCKVRSLIANALKRRTSCLWQLRTCTARPRRGDRPTPRIARR